MASKTLRLARNINAPLVHFVITKGWYLRLQNLKRKKFGFRRLTKAQKKDIRDYWKGYGKHVSTDWCAFYSYTTGWVDRRYIPESLYYGEILMKINQQEMGPGLSDKNMYDRIFDTKQPKAIVRKANGILLDGQYQAISLEEAITLCSEQGSVIVKPASGTYGGSGIRFWTQEEGAEALKDILLSRHDLIAQEIVKQHPFLDSIHPYSLNTLRLKTLMVDNKPMPLCTLIRMGRNKNPIDNSSAGGIICGIDENGFLFKEAVQRDQRVVDRHPDGFVFEGKQVPFYERLIDDAKRMHYRVPYFKLVCWDYSLSPEGEPVLIEANLSSGQIDSHQKNCGPVFAEYTERVLDHVYKGKEL